MSTRVNLYLRDSAVSILSRVQHKGSLVSHLVARAYNKYRHDEQRMRLAGYDIQFERAVLAGAGAYTHWHNDLKTEEFVRQMLSDKVISLVEDILAYTDFINKLAKDTDDIRYTIDWANAHQWFTDGTVD